MVVSSPSRSSRLRVRLLLVTRRREATKKRIPRRDTRNLGGRSEDRPTNGEHFCLLPSASRLHVRLLLVTRRREAAKKTIPRRATANHAGRSEDRPIKGEHLCFLPSAFRMRYPSRANDGHPEIAKPAQAHAAPADDP